MTTPATDQPAIRPGDVVRFEPAKRPVSDAWIRRIGREFAVVGIEPDGTLQVWDSDVEVPGGRSVIYVDRESAVLVPRAVPVGDLQASAKPGLELPPTDLRDAVVAIIERHEVVWVDHDTGWECGCNEHGTLGPLPTAEDARRHQAGAVLAKLTSVAESPPDLREALFDALCGGGEEQHSVHQTHDQVIDAVLHVVQAHVTAEVERARTEADKELDEALRERDETEAIADRLAYSIAPREVIGEHSSGNFPWLNALDLAPKGGWQAAVEQARAEGAAEALEALSERLLRNRDELPYGRSPKMDGRRIGLEDAATLARSIAVEPGEPAGGEQRG